MQPAAHLDLDGTWGELAQVPRLDARSWGPRLRYTTRAAIIDSFYNQISCRLPPFLLYGSGDFHHLAAVFIRRFNEPLTVVSFDNHPDWDIRHPRWSCGAWVNRALELPHVRRVSVWGCGNFELAFPSRLFRNRRALREGRLQVHGWAERQSQAVQRRFDCMTRENWRDRFSNFADRLAGSAIYATVDLDCLRAEEAVTNWENGLFTANDLAWAIGELRRRGPLIGGDVCGAYSPPSYAHWMQRIAGGWDHPRLPSVPAHISRTINATALQAIWPALTDASVLP